MILRPKLAALLVVALLSPSLAHAEIRFEHLTIPDPQGPPIEVGVWSPDPAPVAAASLPLVVISHGTGGDFAAHEDTAAALAEAGFVAAALTHTGDNWRDHSREAQIWDRPRQLKVLVDYMLSDWSGRMPLDPGRVGAFGFSAGGFTVLAAAGGRPDFAKVGPYCQARPDRFECRLLARNGVQLRPRAVVHDPRIKVLVVAGPALGYTFGREGLADVRQPMQLWRAADDQILPHPDYAEAVRQALPVAPELHVVAHAGHFDFLKPCPAELAREVPEICVSAPGFDRAAFHADLNRDVVAFFRKTLESRP